VPLSPEDVQALVAAFDGADWDEMTVTIDGTRLALSRTGRPPTHADGGSPAPTSTAAQRSGKCSDVCHTPAPPIENPRSSIRSGSTLYALLANSMASKTSASPGQ